MFFDSIAWAPSAKLVYRINCFPNFHWLYWYQVHRCLWNSFHQREKWFQYWYTPNSGQGRKVEKASYGKVSALQINLLYKEWHWVTEFASSAKNLFVKKKKRVLELFFSAAEY